MTTEYKPSDADVNFVEEKFQLLNGPDNTEVDRFLMFMHSAYNNVIKKKGVMLYKIDWAGIKYMTTLSCHKVIDELIYKYFLKNAPIGYSDTKEYIEAYKHALNFLDLYRIYTMNQLEKPDTDTPDREIEKKLNSIDYNNKKFFFFLIKLQMVNVMVSLIERHSIENVPYKGEQSICIYKFKKRFQEIVNGKEFSEANTKPLYIDQPTEVEAPPTVEASPTIELEGNPTVEETLGGRKQIRGRRSNRRRRRSSRKTLKKRRKVKRKTKKYAK